MQRAEVVICVIEEVRATLNDDDLIINSSTPLQALKGFDSIAVVSLLERLEKRLEIEMNPALILPESFSTPLTLAEAFMNSEGAR